MKQLGIVLVDKFPDGPGTVRIGDEAVVRFATAGTPNGELFLPTRFATALFLRRIGSAVDFVSTASLEPTSFAGELGWSTQNLEVVLQRLERALEAPARPHLRPRGAL